MRPCIHIVDILDSSNIFQTNQLSIVYCVEVSVILLYLTPTIAYHMLVNQRKLKVQLQIITTPRYLSKHFCVQLFFPKDSIFLLFIGSVGWPHGRYWRRNFLKFRFANCWKMHFSWDFRVFWGVLKKYWLERYIQLSFMLVGKYQNQRVRRKGE